VWQVFHNYGFDAHVIHNHGITVKGFWVSERACIARLAPGCLPVGDF
jgi:hypothetical protein